jgi:hypothetical protein
MKRYWMLRMLKFALFGAAAVAVLGYVVMSLWNWLLPPLAGWHTLGFGQALALLVLCRILFGGLRGGGRGHWRNRLRERWEQMTPEEQERARAGLGRHCRREPSAPPPA